MFFSVLIPVYNAEEYIDRCLNSVINQTEEDFEIVMVDDGSTDQSLQKCREWEKKYPDKIVVIHKDNSGSLETRRECLFHSKGDYLYFIDADDYIIDFDALKTIKEGINKTRCDFVIFNATVDGTRKTKLYSYPFRDGKVYENETLEDIYDVLLSGTQLNTLWNKVFSRNLVDWQEDYSKCKDIIKGTDFYQMLPLLSNAKKVLYIDKVLYLYNVQNNGSISHKFKPLLYRTTCVQHQRLVKISRPWRIQGNKDELLKRRFTSDVAQIILMMNYVKDIGTKGKIDFFKSIREDQMFIDNYSKVGLSKVRKLAIGLFYRKKFYLLLLYIKIVGVYKGLHEMYLSRLS